MLKNTIILQLYKYIFKTIKIMLKINYIQISIKVIYIYISDKITDAKNRIIFK